MWYCNASHEIGSTRESCKQLIGTELATKGRAGFVCLNRIVGYLTILGAHMRIFLFALTAFNISLVLINLFVPFSEVNALDTPPILRGRGLEIVDDSGHIRASITIHPAGEFKPTGKWYPETVVLRLIDEHGRPEVKIAASQDGGGLTCIGEIDTVQTMMHAINDQAFIKLQNRKGLKLISSSE